MPSSGYTAWSVVADEQPTAAKWNILGSNDASFNNGNGFEDNIVIARHLLAGAVTPEKLNAGNGTSWVMQNFDAGTVTNGWSTITGKNVRYMVVGKCVFLVYFIAGTSNSGNAEFTLPLPAKSINGLAVESNTGLIINNGAVISSGQRAYVDPATDPYRAVATYGFTASGTKVIRGQFFYETT